MIAIDYDYLVFVALNQKSKARAVLQRNGVPKAAILHLSELLSYKFATPLYQTATREEQAFSDSISAHRDQLSEDRDHERSNSI